MNPVCTTPGPEIIGSLPPSLGKNDIRFPEIARRGTSGHSASVGGLTGTSFIFKMANAKAASTAHASTNQLPCST